MKVNKGLLVNNNLTISKIQNNQKKDDFNNIHKTFKRFMFKKGDSIILKKSGEIMINTSIKNETPFLSSSTRLNSLIIPTITNTNYINRFAEYNKINNKYIVESNDRLSKIPFSKYKKTRKEEATDAYNKNEMSKDQHLAFFKRMDALNLSYNHSTIIDIIEEDEHYITIIYHVITTNEKKVDYGGPNEFTPILLYHDDIKNKNFYTIPLTYKHKLRRADYDEYFVLKNNESFKNDSIELQRELATCLKKITEVTKFKLLDVNKKCLELLPSEIDPDEDFPDSDYSDFITSWINQLEKLKE